MTQLQKQGLQQAYLAFCWTLYPLLCFFSISGESIYRKLRISCLSNSQPTSTCLSWAAQSGTLTGLSTSAGAQPAQGKPSWLQAGHVPQFQSLLRCISLRLQPVHYRHFIRQRNPLWCRRGKGCRNRKLRKLAGLKDFPGMLWRKDSNPNWWIHEDLWRSKKESRRPLTCILNRKYKYNRSGISSPNQLFLWKLISLCSFFLILIVTVSYSNINLWTQLFLQQDSPCICILFFRLCTCFSGPFQSKIHLFPRLQPTKDSQDRCTSVWQFLPAL